MTLYVLFYECALFWDGSINVNCGYRWWNMEPWTLTTKTHTKPSRYLSHSITIIPEIIHILPHGTVNNSTIRFRNSSSRRSRHSSRSSVLNILHVSYLYVVYIQSSIFLCIFYACTLPSGLVWVSPLWWVYIHR